MHEKLKLETNIYCTCVPMGKKLEWYCCSTERINGYNYYLKKTEYIVTEKQTYIIPV